MKVVQRNISNLHMCEEYKFKQMANSIQTWTNYIKSFMDQQNPFFNYKAQTNSFHISSSVCLIVHGCSCITKYFLVYVYTHICQLEGKRWNHLNGHYSCELKDVLVPSWFSYRSAWGINWFRPCRISWLILDCGTYCITHYTYAHCPKNDHCIIAKI